MAAGIVVREAHFPGRAPVEAYGNGGFRFADMSHRGSILCLPSGVYAWEPANALDLKPSDFARLLAEAEARKRRFRLTPCPRGRRSEPTMCFWLKIAPSRRP
jgi:uncharacterized protein